MRIKTYFFILILSVVLPSLVNAVEVSPSSLNFGYVMPGSSKTLNLTITNPTNNIVVVNLSTSDPDDNFSVKPDIVVLGANESTTITVTFKAPDTKATFNNSLIVEYGNLHKTVSLTATTIGTVSMSVNPENIDFGDVPVGQRKSVNITVGNNGDVPITNLKVSTSDGIFSVPNISVGELLPGQTTTIPVIFIPTTQGTFNGSLYVASDQTIVTVSLKGNVPYTTGLFVSRNEINFGIVPVGQSKAESFYIENRGTGILNVVLKATPNVFTVQPEQGEIKPGQRVGIIVTYTPPLSNSTNSSYRGVLSILSNDKNAPNINISLVGETSSKSNLLSSLPQSLNFGYVKIGKQTEKFIRIINNTTTTLNVRIWLTGDTNFSLPSNLSSTVTIATGEAKIIPVLFKPDSKTYYSGTLQFTSDNYQLHVALSGYGDDGNIGIPESAPPPQSSSSGGGGGGCSIIGDVSKNNDLINGNVVLMFLIPAMIVLKRFYRILFSKN